MSSPNEIGSLQKIMVKPAQWRILQSIDGSYSLEFTHMRLIDQLPPSVSYEETFAPVMTRRDTIKNYKTMNAVFSDIQKVQQDALIHYYAAQVG